MTGQGLAALPEGDRVDFEAIRSGRRRRLLQGMQAGGLDALVLGRPSDISFASGVRALFTTGSRPYSPGCVLVGDQIHVLADHDEGIPDDIPHEQIFGRSWSPGIAATRVAAIPGLSKAKRIGTAGTSPGVERLLASIVPEAEVVDARALVQEARARKSPGEIAVIETACTLAEAGLAAMQDAVRAGATTRQLVGRCAERLGQLGVTVLPDGFVAHRTALGISAGFDDTPLTDGDLVSLSPSVSYGGYDGTIARTVVTGGSISPSAARLRNRTSDALAAVVGACTPGASGADLLAAWAREGGQDFGGPLAIGLGVGVEEPIIGLGLDSANTLAPGMVLAVQGWTTTDAIGGWHHRDVVHVTDTGPRLLTRSHLAGRA